MISTILKPRTWLAVIAIFVLSSFMVNAIAQNTVTFSVTSGGTPVKGISVTVEAIVLKTNSSGEAVILLPDGDYSYMVSTAGYDETIVVGSNTITYFDEGGSDRDERYDNIFKTPANITVSGDVTENISLAATTFNTTVGGGAASADFNILAEYLNRSGYLKTKTITTLTSNESGTITIPLPTHRDDRDENILSFDAYYTSNIYDNNITAFDPLVSPVTVSLAAENTVDFTITAGGTAVEGIYVTVAGKSLKTDAQGQLSLDLPDGTYYYSVYSGGNPESFIIGSDTYTYMDLGGRDLEDRYDNIFVANEAIIVSGATTKNVTLGFTTFKTKDQGVDASLSFDVIAEYSGGKIKTIAELTSNATGDIALPLPTHRNDRYDDTLAFYNFQYEALSGMLTDLFIPEGSLVTIDIPETYEITFDVQAGGTAVEGITVGVEDITLKTDEWGQVSLSLPAGDYNYSVFTGKTPETIIIGANTFTYNDHGNWASDAYDNVFVVETPFTVTEAATKNISLTTTTFHTTVGGTVASVEFDILADYLNRSGSLKTKTITTLTSNESGTITLPLPTHRDDRASNILSFDAYYAYDNFGNIITSFDPLVSPVSIAVAQSNALDFTITAGGTAVEGIYVYIAGKTARSDALGQLSIDLPDGTYYYSVFSDGDPESFIIGSDTYTYLDMGGRDNREDSYENIFMANAPVTVSGASSESVDLDFTAFKTKVDGVDASASFDVIAEYSGGKIKTIAELTSNASGDIALPLPTHRNDNRDDTLAFSYYQYWAFGGLVNDTFELDDNPVIIEFPTTYATTFNVQAGGIAVEGITVDIDGEVFKTDASGQVILNLPAGDYSYSVYTGGTPETITIGANTVTFMDMGERGSIDSYDNIFVQQTPVTVSGMATVNITLATTTFQTTVGGTAASVEFDISAAYINDVAEEKRKPITTLTSDASGNITFPMPTHRNDRSGDTLEYYDFLYSDLAQSTLGLFDPTDSPVLIAISSQHNTTFTVMAGTDPVQGITVGINKLESITDASGMAVLNVPEGEFDYILYTYGLNETLIIGGESFNYLDMSGIGFENSYDNIFDRGSVIVTGEGTTNISLLTPDFKTTKGGVAAPADFAINADYVNNNGDDQVKTIIQVKSDAAGEISFPLPTHRTSREGPILEFISYSYADLLGMFSGDFDPDSSPILIEFPSGSDVVFSVSSGGEAVEGITVRVKELTAVTNASGELTLSLPDGNYDYILYTAGKTETITIEGTIFTYLEEGGNEDYWMDELGYLPNFYDNVFDLGSLDVSGAATMDIEIGSTTFETTVNGYAAPVSLIISGDYINVSGSLRTKKITTFSTGTGGTISLPIPKYRDDRQNNILDFITYHYSDISNTATGIFNPEVSPVQIAFNNLNEVIFRITNSVTTDPISGAIVQVNGAALMATDANGETSTGLVAGTYHYTVTKGGYAAIESTTFEANEATMTINVAMDANVGIHQQLVNSFTFYPNPASEVITFRFNEPYSGTIDLYSIRGSLVKQFQFENELSGTMHISDLESGMYIIKAGAYSKRLIIN